MPDEPEVEFVPYFVIVVATFSLLGLLVASIVQLMFGNIGFALAAGLPSLLGLGGFSFQMYNIHKMITRHNEWKRKNAD